MAQPAQSQQTGTPQHGPGWGKARAILRRITAADAALGVMALLVAGLSFSGSMTVTAAGVALAGLSVFVTVVVVAFARRQLRADPRRHAFTRLAAGVALGTVLMAFSGDVLLLVAGWIVTCRLMAGLIGHVGAWDEAQQAARRAAVCFTISDLAVVGAAIVLSLSAGSTSIATMNAAIPAMPAALTTGAGLLLVLAAMVRCATPPFSRWLLGSLAAPTPVSALMHAGFVNAGGFLLVRFAPVLEAAPVAGYALFGAGLCAAIIGSAVMLVRSDIKGALTASTVAQMGFMLLTIALGAYAAALWHMVAHGLFKAWLFLGSSGTVSSAPARQRGLRQPVPALLALGVMIVAGASLTSAVGPALLPSGLALTALASALIVALQGGGRNAHGLALVMVPLALVLINAAVLLALEAAQAAAPAPLLSPIIQFGVLSLVLGLWIMQQRILAGEETLHPAMVARLMHMGSPPVISPPPVIAAPAQAREYTAKDQANAR